MIRGLLMSAALVVGACAESHLICEEEVVLDGDVDSEIDASAPACSTSGRLVIGPIVSLLDDGRVVPCSEARGTEISITVLDVDRAPVRALVHECDDGDFADVGRLAVGRYSLVVTSNRAGIAGGGEIVGSRACSGAEPPTWCAALVVDVGMCGLDVVPAVMNCNPDEAVDC